MSINIEFNEFYNGLLNHFKLLKEMIELIDENSKIINGMKDATYNEWETAFLDSGIFRKLVQNSDRIKEILNELYLKDALNKFLMDMQEK